MRPLRLALSALLGMLPLAVFAVNLTWDNEVGDKNWGSPSNWAPDQLPGAVDNLTFANLGADATGGAVVTSILDLAAPSPFAINHLYFLPAATNLAHRVNLDGNTLRVNGELRSGHNAAGGTATLTNGAVQLGASPSARAGNATIGYRGATTPAVPFATTLRLDAGAPLTAYTGFLDIGSAFANGNAAVTSVLDLTAAGNVVIDATRVRLGLVSFAGSGLGQTTGGLYLPTTPGATASLAAPTIWLGNADQISNAGALQEIRLGPSTAVNTDDLVIGRIKSRGSVRFATGVVGGTLNLSGQSSGAANLRIGYNVTDTGTIAEGTLNLTGGTFNAALGELAIGVHNSGTGAGKGTLVMDAGAVTAASVVLARPHNAGTSTAPAATTGWLEMNGGSLTVTGSVTDGAGAGTVLVDHGTMTVAGGFQADTLRVGHSALTGVAATAVLDVNGPVVVGGGTATIDIGRSETPNAAPIESILGTADFADAPSVQMSGTELRQGTVNADGQTSSRGILRLSVAGTNTLSFATIRVGHSAFSGNTAGLSELRFGGGANTVQADNLHIGQQKSLALSTLAAGGRLTLTGRAGPEANLFVGNNDNAGTGVAAAGTFDLSAGTFNAALNQIVVGRHGGGSGSGRGTLRMGLGTVTARSLLLASTSFNGTSSNPASTQGTVVLDGGTIAVNGPVTDGGGASRLEVLEGAFSARGAFTPDIVLVGRAAGAPAVLSVATLEPAQNFKVPGLTVESSGELRLGLSSAAPAALVTNVLFAVGSRIDAFASDTQPQALGVSTVEASTWIGVTNVWDSASASRWDRGLPAGAVIATGSTQTVLRALGNLTDNGLVSANPDWTVQVTQGVNGQVDLVRAGPAIQSAQLVAEIITPTSVVTRPGSLTVGNLSGSGADAAALSIRAGSLRVLGSVLDDGGTAAIAVDGGSLQVDGGLSCDFLRAGYNGLAAQVRADGPVRLGNGTETFYLGRRDTGDVTTSATADFSLAPSIDLRGESLHLGTNISGANTSVMGSLTLSALGTNFVSVTNLVIGSSSAAANPVLSQLRLGTGSNLILADNAYIGRQKSYGRLDVPAGGTLTLAGRGAGAMNLFLGYNDTATGTEARGTLDLTGVTVSATLGQVVLGWHNNDASGTSLGSGKGTFTLSAGQVSATSVVLARTGAAGTTNNPSLTTGSLTVNGGTFTVSGGISDLGGTSLLNVQSGAVTAASLDNLDTLTLAGGSLTAPVVSRASGATAFTFSGGTLSTRLLDLGDQPVTQTGGIFSPGAPQGVTPVDQGYTLAGGTWRLEHGGFTNDLVRVNGPLALGPGSVLDLASTAPAYSEFHVLAEYTSLTGAFGVTNNLPAGWTIDYVHQGQNRIALVQIPGPVTNLVVAVENGQVVVRWTTGDETGVTGFHVERLTAAPVWQRLTASPIPALGGTSGNAYAYTDTTAEPGRAYRYRIVVLRGPNPDQINGPYERLAAQVLRLDPPTILSPTDATIRWASNEGVRYRVLRTLALEAPVWQTVQAGVLATPPQNTWTDNAAGGDRYYYQIQVEP